MSYMVKEVAKIAGVSVRTLHYYDEIGLLKPQNLNSSGYRIYSDSDLERLQQIMFFKELEFNLQDISKIIDSPNFDRKKALLIHKELLTKKLVRLKEIISSVEKTIKSIEGGIKMDKKEMFNGFDMKEIERHQSKYAKEVEKKYGNTDAYKQSLDKTSKYSKEDWAYRMNRASEIYSILATLMEKGPNNLEVQEVIGQWRQHITENFYDCTIEIFKGLGELYVNDERFTNYIDKYKPGLAKFMRDAIHIYCNNMENN